MASGPQRAHGVKPSWRASDTGSGIVGLSRELAARGQVVARALVDDPDLGAQVGDRAAGPPRRSAPRPARRRRVRLSGVPRPPRVPAVGRSAGSRPDSGGLLGGLARARPRPRSSSPARAALVDGRLVGQRSGRLGGVARPVRPARPGETVRSVRRAPSRPDRVTVVERPLIANGRPGPPMVGGRQRHRPHAGAGQRQSNTSSPAATTLIATDSQAHERVGRGQRGDQQPEGRQHQRQDEVQHADRAARRAG